jgi:endonuclease/exonuclease/phosphatase family metal-dependent hydrolase
MKPSFLSVLVLGLFAVGCATQSAQTVKQRDASSTPAKTADAAAPQGAPNELTVMTYNLRCASSRPPNSWPQRREAAHDVIRSANPDLIGTQEGLYQQLKDIEADQNGEYAWIGLGREGGSKGEFMAVFYRKSRFEPLAYDHFWLSDTPNVIGSATWGHTNRRMVTWVRFKDRLGKREFYFWNTHLDHQVQPAREKGAELIRKRIDALGTSVPIILTGDFNAAAKNNKAYDILTEGGFLKDTWKGEEQGSFHNFKGSADPKLGRIDWILTRGDITAESTEILKFNKNGQYPSDHFPVVAKLRFP